MRRGARAAIVLAYLAALTPLGGLRHGPLTAAAEPATAQVPAPAGVQEPPGNPEIFELRRQPAAPPPSVRAQSAILVDLDSGQVLWQRDARARRAPASLTKVMTALVALDHLRPEDELTVPGTIQSLPWDSTRMGLVPGERVSTRDLMYGLFLNSGNDAALTLAGAAASQAAFVDEMNRKAAQLGLADTHFANPVGLDDPGHFSSAYDLSVATAQLLTHTPAVRGIAGTLDAELPATATHRAFHLHNLNWLLRSYPGATGLKTGWTGHAGGCLIATATREGRHLLAVLLGSPSPFADGAALLDYGFARPA